MTIRGVAAVGALVAAAWAAPAPAQTLASDADVRALIQERLDQGLGRGIVVGLLEADGSTRVVAAGDGGDGGPALGPEAVFEIGSITKAFAGVLLAEMVARGEVELGGPVEDLLPDSVSVPAGAEGPVTLEHLVTHHSGLARIPSNLRPSNPANPYADYTVRDLYQYLNGAVLMTEPGMTYAYSNLGMGLLGHALGRVAGTSFDELLRERVLGPLGMDHTGSALTPEMESHMVQGHDLDGRAVPLWDLPTLAAAGALRSDARDMLRFLAANVGAPSSTLERAMRASHEARRTVSPDMAVGLAWHVRTTGEGRIVWHNGGTGGFRTFLGFDPDRGTGVVVLTNTTHGADDIGFHLLHPGVPLDPPGTPAARPTVDVPEAVLARYVGTYEMTPQFSLDVSLADGRLEVQATGQPSFVLYPSSEVAFFLRAVEASITFQVGVDGAVSGLVLHQGGRDQPARKVR